MEDVQRGAFVIEELQTRDYVRIGELLSAYADLRLGFVDAAVLAVVERFGERQVASLDRRHFAAVLLNHTAALQLLPAGSTG